MNAAEIRLERGRMFWYGAASGGVIFAVGDDGTWMEMADEWAGQALEPVTAPSGLLTPERGFGFAWQAHDLQEWLGFARGHETAFEGEFEETGEGWRLRDKAGTWLVLEWGRERVPGPEPEPKPEPEPEPEPEPMPVDPPGNAAHPPELNVQRWHLVKLPGFVLNIAAFIWLNHCSDGTVRGRLWRPCHDDAEVELPEGIAFEGDNVMVLSGEWARVLWEYVMSVAAGLSTD